jgi:hypothetical protein
MKPTENPMKTYCATRWALAALLGLGFLGATVLAAPLVLPDFMTYATNGSGVYGHKDSPKLPWCEWRQNDPNRPAPRRVAPGKAGPPAAVPADAIVLFDGKDLSQWQPTDHTVQDGCLVAPVKSKSMLTSKQEFGSAQIHVEWMAPAGFEAPWDERGNNGVFLMGVYEIQIFDSFNEKIYPDGQCAAIYDETPPLVNVTRPPGEWQTYDILFTAPVFENGKVVKPGRVTMLHNGVLVHLAAEIHAQGRPRTVPEVGRQIGKGPLALGAHNCPVRFRSIWVRPL